MFTVIKKIKGITVNVGLPRGVMERRIFYSAGKKDDMFFICTCSTVNHSLVVCPATCHIVSVEFPEIKQV